MKPIKASFKIILLALIAILFGFNVQSQTAGDSLSLTNIIKKVIENHPSVKSAAESINAADAGIGLAKSAYLPTIDGTASRPLQSSVSFITIQLVRRYLGSARPTSRS